MGFFVVKKIESMEFDEEFDAWVGIKNQKGELVCLDCMTGVGTPGGSIRSGSKETKMKEDMIRSYVRKRYGIVGDDWEVGEVQEEHSEELRNRGEGETHPLIPKILEKLIRTQGRIPPSITL